MKNYTNVSFILRDKVKQMNDLPGGRCLGSDGMTSIWSTSLHPPRQRGSGCMSHAWALLIPYMNKTAAHRRRERERESVAEEQKRIEKSSECEGRRRRQANVKEEEFGSSVGRQSDCILISYLAQLTHIGVSDHSQSCRVFALFTGEQPPTPPKMKCKATLVTVSTCWPHKNVPQQGWTLKQKITWYLTYNILLQEHCRNTTGGTVSTHLSIQFCQQMLLNYHRNGELWVFCSRFDRDCAATLHGLQKRTEFTFKLLII